MALDYRTIIVEESARFSELLQAGPLDAQVPGCPDWTLGDLGVHMCNVQRWATWVIENGKAGEATEPPPEPADVATAFAATTPKLLVAIAASDPDAECWNFGPGPQVTSFWYRRQALEVAMHRWDAESAVSESPAPLVPEVAADVIDEFIHLMMPRIIERESVDLSGLDGDVHIHCTNTAGEWTFEVVDGALVVTDEHRKSAVAARGEASQLALMLQNRVGIDAVEVFGETGLLDAWLGKLHY